MNAFELKGGGIGLAAIAACALALQYALRRGMERRRFMLDVIALLVCGPPLGALAGWLVLESAPPPMGGPANGNIVYLLLAIPVTVLVGLTGACVGLGWAEKAQTGRKPSAYGYFGALGGLLFGGLLAVGEIMALEHVPSRFRYVAAFLLLPFTVGSMGVVGFFLVDVARPPDRAGQRLRRTP